MGYEAPDFKLDNNSDITPMVVCNIAFVLAIAVAVAIWNVAGLVNWAVGGVAAAVAAVAVLGVGVEC